MACGSHGQRGVIGSRHWRVLWAAWGWHGRMEVQHAHTFGCLWCMDATAALAAAATAGPDLGDREERHCGSGHAGPRRRRIAVLDGHGDSHLAALAGL